MRFSLALILLSFVNTVKGFKPPTTSRKLTSPLFFVDPPEEPPPENNFDPVEKYAEFVGFEPEEKWKAVRYTAYYWAGFVVVGDIIKKMLENNNNPFN